MGLIKRIIDKKRDLGYIGVYAYATEEVAKMNTALSQLKMHINDLGKMADTPKYYWDRIKILKATINEIEEQLKIISREIN